MMNVAGEHLCVLLLRSRPGKYLRAALFYSAVSSELLICLHQAKSEQLLPNLQPSESSFISTIKRCIIYANNANLNFECIFSGSLSLLHFEFETWRLGLHIHA